MTPSCNLLKHNLFKQNITDFFKSFPQSDREAIKKQLISTVNKIKTNPLSCARIKEIKNEGLKGRIRKAYVGGNKRYRLYFIYYRDDKDKEIIIPFYLSMQKRADINYNKEMIVFLEKLANKVAEDLKNNNHSAFENL